MGVPKTKWSGQEEAALITGVKKFGIGKWRLIQKDPELGEILRQRSNVDLKDKWRNMHPSASDGEGGGGVRADRAPPAKPKASKDKSAARAASGGAAQAHPPAPDKRQYEKKLEDLVFEAVRTLKQAATLEGIAVHIEDKYDVPAEFRKQLAAHLKSLADAGKLVKSKTAFTLPGRGGPPKGGYDVKMAGYRNKPGGKVPEFLIDGKRMTAEEMAEEAARAVRAAEEAASAAEAAAREAEQAEAEAIALEQAASAGR